MSECERAVTDSFARVLSTLCTFLSLLHTTNFPVFWQNWKLHSSPVKILAGPEECQKIFLLLRHLQPAKTYNLARKKNVTLGSTDYLKIHSNKYLVCHFLISASPSVEVDEVKLSLVRVDN
jgi:hypothetical protein